MKLDEALSLLELESPSDLEQAERALEKRLGELERKLIALPAGSSKRQELAQKLSGLSEALEVVRNSNPQHHRDRDEKPTERAQTVFGAFDPDALKAMNEDADERSNVIEGGWEGTSTEEDDAGATRVQPIVDVPSEQLGETTQLQAAEIETPPATRDADKRSGLLGDKRLLGGAGVAIVLVVIVLVFAGNDGAENDALTETSPPADRVSPAPEETGTDPEPPAAGAPEPADDASPRETWALLRDRIQAAHDELAGTLSAAETRVEDLTNQVAPIQARDPEALSPAEQSLLRDHALAVELLALIKAHVVDDLFLLDLQGALAAQPANDSDEAVLAVVGRLERIYNVTQRRFWNLSQITAALEARAWASAAVLGWESLGLSWPVDAVQLSRMVDRSPETSDPNSLSGEELLASLQRAGVAWREANAAFEEGRFSDAAAQYEEIAVVLERSIRWAEERVTSVDQQIALLFEQGEEAAEDYRLTSPASESALYYLREIEAIAPDRPEVDELRSIIQQRYLALIRSQLARDGIEKAESYVSRAGSVGPDTPEMDRIRQLMADYRSSLNEREAELVAEAERQARAGNVEGLAEAIETLAAEIPRSRSLESLRAQLVELRFKPGQAVTEYAGIEMVALPTGTFQMGFDRGGFGNLFAPRSERPAHDVTVSRPVAISRHEISVGQFARFVEETGYVTDAENAGRSEFLLGDGLVAIAEKSWRHDFLGNEAGENLPVIHVSWRDASAFTEWLSEKTGALYRLPSETEFEYAARAGSDSNRPWDGDEPPRDFGNFLGDGDPVPADWRAPGDSVLKRALRGYSDGHFGPAPVGTFEPNDYGAESLLGNVAEWTLDCYADNYRGKGSSQQARSEQGCSNRVVRGLHWGSDEGDLRVTFREERTESYSANTIGFRVAREIQQ
ncbi:MAG: SUMF1/EgtB/PvdO family nonheme iron enzyme [Xanthomonadales bacterium]|nr:SUMF1/EgtB/PvdO family nonheme iron enzyme [Xanthomonadales bacterium]